MSKKILPRKLSANRAVSAGSPIVVEEKKEKKRQGSLPMFLLAVGLGAVALASITLLAPVAFYGHVDSPGSIDDSGSRADGAVVAPTALAASATAIDGNGAVIEDNGSTKSGEMTITGYSGKSYSTE